MDREKIWDSLVEIVSQAAEKIEKDAVLNLRPGEKANIINAAAGEAYRLVMEQVREEFYRVFDDAKKRIGEVAL